MVSDRLARYTIPPDLPCIAPAYQTLLPEDLALPRKGFLVPRPILLSPTNIPLSQSALNLQILKATTKKSPWLKGVTPTTGFIHAIDFNGWETRVEWNEIASFYWFSREPCHNRYEIFKNVLDTFMIHDHAVDANCRTSPKVVNTLDYLRYGGVGDTVAEVKHNQHLVSLYVPPREELIDMARHYAKWLDQGATRNLGAQDRTSLITWDMWTWTHRLKEWITWSHSKFFTSALQEKYLATCYLCGKAVLVNQLCCSSSTSDHCLLDFPNGRDLNPAWLSRLVGHSLNTTPKAIKGASTYIAETGWPAPRSDGPLSCRGLLTVDGPQKLHFRTVIEAMPQVDTLHRLSWWEHVCKFNAQLIQHPFEIHHIPGYKPVISSPAPNVLFPKDLWYPINNETDDSTARKHNHTPGGSLEEDEITFHTSKKCRRNPQNITLENQTYDDVDLFNDEHLQMNPLRQPTPRRIQDWTIPSLEELTPESARLWEIFWWDKDNTWHEPIDWNKRLKYWGPRAEILRLFRKKTNSR